MSGRAEQNPAYPPNKRASGERLSVTLHGSETVLIVEDDTPIRRVIARELRRLGYQVLEAAEGHEACRRAEEHLARIDLVICDVMMPGMLGPEVAERLRALHVEARVLFVSGYSVDELVRFGVDPSVVNVLRKPFSPVELAERVRVALDAA
jgi:two-component system cell cycle sensor histidine kinase/response regulator CckA